MQKKILDEFHNIESMAYHIKQDLNSLSSSIRNKVNSELGRLNAEYINLSKMKIKKKDHKILSNDETMKKLFDKVDGLRNKYVKLFKMTEKSEPEPLSREEQKEMEGGFLPKISEKLKDEIDEHLALVSKTLPDSFDKLHDEINKLNKANKQHEFEIFKNMHKKFNNLSYTAPQLNHKTHQQVKSINTRLSKLWDDVDEKITNIQTTYGQKAHQIPNESDEEEEQQQPEQEEEQGEGLKGGDMQKGQLLTDYQRMTQKPPADQYKYDNYQTSAPSPDEVYDDYRKLYQTLGYL